MMSMRGISAGGRQELSRLLSGGRRILTPTEVASMLGIDSESAAKKLARWAKDGWLRRARRGLYIPVPVDVEDASMWSEDPLILADAVWSPCYFTGWTAANHWGLTEQVFRTTVLKTSARVRRSNESLLEHQYLLAHVPESAFEWGLRRVWREERKLLVADPARVVVDALDDPVLVGGIRHGAEIVEAYLADHPASRLIEYGDRLGNGTVFKRLGYVVERVVSDADELLVACESRVPSGVTQLDPSGPSGGDRDARWNLRINVGLNVREPS